MLQSKDTEWQIGLKNKTKPRDYNMLPQETHFRAKDTHRLKVRGWKKIFMEMARKQALQYS